MSAPKTLLSAKHRRLHPRAQIQTLARIGRRAALHAEWLETLLGTSGGDRGNPAFGSHLRMHADGYLTDLDIADTRRKVRESRAKASQALAEVTVLKAEADAADRLRLVKP